MDITSNGGRSRRLVSLYASLIFQISIVLFGFLHINCSLAATGRPVIPDSTESIDIDDEWQADFLAHTSTGSIDENEALSLKNQIIEASHQALDSHYLDKTRSSYNRRHLMLGVAVLGIEITTVAASDVESLAIFLAGLKSLQSHSCNNYPPYTYNQTEACESLSGNNKSINTVDVIRHLFTKMARLFHEDSNSELRMIESDKIVVIYFPDGNNIVLPRDTIESEYNLLQKYENFKTNFARTADFNCNSNVEGRQCGVYTYNNQKSINSDMAYQIFNDGTNSDTRIVKYNNKSLICDEYKQQRKRQLMKRNEEIEENCQEEEKTNNQQPRQPPQHKFLSVVQKKICEDSIVKTPPDDHPDSDSDSDENSQYFEIDISKLDNSNENNIDNPERSQGIKKSCKGLGSDVANATNCEPARNDSSNLGTINNFMSNCLKCFCNCFCCKKKNNQNKELQGSELSKNLDTPHSNFCSCDICINNQKIGNHNVIENIKT
ncbi:hypothetical protein N9A19_00235 [Porticoccaceae bacterium]|nr:hypothetical protein [Porticoccaceae bacterium]